MANVDHSLAPVENLWNEWEIHCLILASLALQFLLFFTAGMRRRSTSSVLSTVLWLAYLSADSLAIFVLGHLAVRGGSGPEHELILFWAPFLLVHLGGQDTITALSVQDNELWTRHLLGFVSQVAVAGYDVSKSSWSDRRLLAATVIVFLAGSLKYAGRTYCLYSASPANVRVAALRNRSEKLHMMKSWASLADVDGMVRLAAYRFHAVGWLSVKFDLMLGKTNKRMFHLEDIEIMSADAPLNEVFLVLYGDDLPTWLEKFQSTSCPRGPYKFVSEKLLQCYEMFYTRRPILDFSEGSLIFGEAGDFTFVDRKIILWLIATIFQYLSNPITLLLFILAEKGHPVHSRADVVVTYILLVGAIILDVSSAFMSVFSAARTGRLEDWITNKILCVANYIQPSWSTKLWSENLAQYSMVKRYTMEDSGCITYVWRQISKRLTTWGVDLLDPALMHTPVTEDLKGFVLNSLLQFGTNKQYNIANFRGQAALQKWRREGPGTTSLYYSINGVKDFPTSVLIWHIATNICYYSGNNNTDISDSNISKKKQMSRELSNYILYLVFKCDVLLTSNSRLVHNEVLDEMEKILVGERTKNKVYLQEREAFMKVFEYTEYKQRPSTANEEQEQPVYTDSDPRWRMEELLNSIAEAIYSPVLPRASKVARELICIEKEDERWDLISAVWLEMLYYSAPRCGGAFHYKHLATGGEFITHVLLLMRSLGPFLPGPATGSSTT